MSPMLRGFMGEMRVGDPEEKRFVVVFALSNGRPAVISIETTINGRSIRPRFFTRAIPHPREIWACSVTERTARWTTESHCTQNTWSMVNMEGSSVSLGYHGESIVPERFQGKHVRAIHDRHSSGFHRCSSRLECPRRIRSSDRRLVLETRSNESAFDIPRNWGVP